MRSSQGIAWAWPDNRRHELAILGPKFSGQHYHTGQHNRCQENRAVLDKREWSQNRSRGQNVWDRWTMLRRWLGGSCSIMQTWKSIDVPLHLYGNCAHGGLQRGAAGDQTRPWFDDQDETHSKGMEWKRWLSITTHSLEIGTGWT